ncbi:MAG: HD family hydrolase [Caldilineaceae bacterium]|nr:HD family hydrolase [Caldilineaceae bacterium]
MSQSLLRLLDNANALKRLPRTGWLLAGVPAAESVADHAYATTLLAMLLADLINADYASYGLSQPLDTDKVLRIALLHDLPESLLTDLPKRSAELLGREVKHAAEREAAARLLSEFEAGSAYVALWEEYAGAASPEARLVKDADKLEMVHQARTYASAARSHVAEFFDGHTWYYAVSAELHKALADDA